MVAVCSALEIDMIWINAIACRLHSSFDSLLLQKLLLEDAREAIKSEISSLNLEPSIDGMVDAHQKQLSDIFYLYRSAQPSV